MCRINYIYVHTRILCVVHTQEHQRLYTCEDVQVYK